jgi:hypothetical protein
LVVESSGLKATGRYPRALMASFKDSEKEADGTCGTARWGSRRSVAGIVSYTWPEVEAESSLPSCRKNIQLFFRQHEAWQAQHPSHFVVNSMLSTSDIPSATLTLHSTKFCTKFKIFRKKYYFVLRLPLRHFQAFPKIWKSHVFREAHKRNFELVDETLIFQGHLNSFWGSFMASPCSSRWSDQECCKTECVTLKSTFQTRPMWAV